MTFTDVLITIGVWCCLTRLVSVLLCVARRDSPEKR